MEHDEAPNDRFVSGHPIPPEPNRHLPLDLYIDRELLMELLEQNMSAIVENAAHIDRDDESRAETTAMLLERESFLAWLISHPGPNVYVALYPLSEEAQPDA
jgi:endonuclease/exonuclease/phosphatase family metal-dependent hydrolase